MARYCVCHASRPRNIRYTPFATCIIIAILSERYCDALWDGFPNLKDLSMHVEAFRDLYFLARKAVQEAIWTMSS